MVDFTVLHSFHMFLENQNSIFSEMSDSIELTLAMKVAVALTVSNRGRFAG